MIEEIGDKREKEKWTKLQRNLRNKKKTMEFQEQQFTKIKVDRENCRGK